MQKKTVTIGISAYNEEANIRYLLNALLQEKPKKARIEKIIVISDGSTDRTTALLNEYSDERLQIIIQKKRKGLHPNQNRIVRLVQSDVLILLDADVLPQKGFIDAIVEPILKNHTIGLVGADTIPASPNGIFERIIFTGRHLKQNIYKNINHGNNVYLCHGRARAFSKKLYSQIRWPYYCPEDAYSYFFCLEKGYKFAFAKDAKVTFRVPSSLKDYIEKNNRFIAGRQRLQNYFPESVVKRHYHIPFKLLVNHIAKCSLKSPVATITYLAFFVYSRANIVRYHTYQPIWKISS